MFPSHLILHIYHQLLKQQAGGQARHPVPLPLIPPDKIWKEKKTGNKEISQILIQRIKTI